MRPGRTGRCHVNFGVGDCAGYRHDEVLDVLVRTRRNKWAALKLIRKLLKKYGFVPDKLVTDHLR